MASSSLGWGFSLRRGRLLHLGAWCRLIARLAHCSHAIGVSSTCYDAQVAISSYWHKSRTELPPHLRSVAVQIAPIDAVACAARLQIRLPGEVDRRPLDLRCGLFASQPRALARGRFACKARNCDQSHRRPRRKDILHRYRDLSGRYTAQLQSLPTQFHAANALHRVAIRLPDLRGAVDRSTFVCGTTRPEVRLRWLLCRSRQTTLAL